MTVSVEAAIGLMIAIALAGTYAIDRPRLARWWHRRRCTMCARREQRGTVVWR